MGFLTSIFSTAVKVVVSPIAVVKDVVDGDLSMGTTSNILGSATDSLSDSVDDLLNGDLF